MAKRYEKLKGLPATGPMYITIQNSSSYSSYVSNYSEGFVVRFFKSDGEEWVANFKKGITQFNAIFELENPNLLIIAGGLTYIMNPDYEDPISTSGTIYKEGFQASDDIIILYDNSEVTIFKKDGSFWISDQISLDGLINIAIKDNIITGKYSDYSRDWKWFDFALNIDTKEITGIMHYPQPKTKPWWKIW